MKAIMKVAAGVGNVEVCDIPEPIPDTGQVKMKVHAAGLCGTDLLIYQDKFKSVPPVVLGHEIAGEVIEVGKDVSESLLGTRVTPEPLIQTCPSDHPLQNEHSHHGRDQHLIGSSAPGGFAEYLVVPAQNLHHIPEHISYREGALIEPLACVIQSVLLTYTTVRAGDLVVITGPGPIGLLTLQILKACQATVVMVGTRDDSYRLSVADNLGADYVVTSETRDLPALVQDVSMLGLGADMVYECSGSNQAAQQLLGLVRYRGSYVQMGYFGKSIHWDLDQVRSKELIVTGRNGSTPASWTRARRLLSNGTVKMNPLLTHDFTLSQWDDAINMVNQKRTVKALFRPQYHQEQSIDSSFY